jgi:hypothetical protein
MGTNMYCEHLIDTVVCACFLGNGKRIAEQTVAGSLLVVRPYTNNFVLLVV